VKTLIASIVRGVLVAMLAVGACAFADPQRYELTAIGRGLACALDNRGEITGFGASSNPSLYSRGELIEVPPGNGGYSYGSGRAINDHGQVAGTWSDQWIFLYAKGTTRDLPVRRYAMAIDNEGRLLVRQPDAKHGGVFLYKDGRSTYLSGPTARFDNVDRRG
jgi:hypothetical protein